MTNHDDKRSGGSETSYATADRTRIEAEHAALGESVLEEQEFTRPDPRAADSPRSSDLQMLEALAEWSEPEENDGFDGEKLELSGLEARRVWRRIESRRGHEPSATGGSRRPWVGVAAVAVAAAVVVSIVLIPRESEESAQLAAGLSVQAHA